MRKTIPILILVIVVVSAGIAINKWVLNSEAGPTLSKFYGNVEIREVNLGFRVPGRIEKMLLDEGDPVNSGQLMAVLDASPYEIELAAMQARQAASAADLQRLESGFRQEEIAQAQAHLEQRQAALTRTRKDLKRIRNLTISGSATQQELDRMEAAHEEAVAGLALARANLDLVQTGFREEEIAAARAGLKEAKASVSRIQLQIEDTRLHSPSKGTVLIRAQEPGAIVAGGQIVFTMSLQDKTWVRAYIPEPRLGEIYPGLPVRVLTDSRPGKPYMGNVGFIASRAEFTPKNVQTEELRSDLVFRFRVVLDNPDQQLRQGMPVTVELVPDK